MGSGLGRVRKTGQRGAPGGEGGLGLGGGRGDALRPRVIRAGTKDEPGFWARSRGCLRSHENPKRRRTKRTHLKEKHTRLRGISLSRC